jgi:predicted alpha/beta-hydrolase family hydrolase
MLHTSQNTGMLSARMLLTLTGMSLGSLVMATDRTVQVTWGTGRHVTAIFSYPPNQGKLPVVIIASGRTGGMATGVIKGLADKAVRDGLVAVRFDYEYYAAKREPSKGLVDESDQMDAVIGEALKDPRIDSKRVVIAGKSLGSVVAHRAFGTNSAFLGEVLLTPVIPTIEDGQRLYPNLPIAGRPTALVIGNTDTENAPLGVVYNYLKDASRKIMVDIVAGDHGFGVTDLTTESGKRLNDANADAALEVAEYWVRQIAHVAPPMQPTVTVTKAPAMGKKHKAKQKVTTSKVTPR